MNKKFFVAIISVVGFILITTYNACVRPSDKVVERSETIYGNPVVEVSFSPYAPAGSKNIADLCIKEILFYPDETPLNPVSILVSSENLVLGHSGRVFVRTSVARSVYSRATVKLNASCMAQRSLGIENQYGVFSSTEDLSLNFIGKFESDSGFTRLDFDAQLLMNSLSNVSSNNEIRVVADIHSGTWATAREGWRTMSYQNAPDISNHQAAVWTGTELLGWGGVGGRYNPVLDSWTLISNVGAPESVSYFAYGWTGKELIIWGGLGAAPAIPYLNTGARYNPSTDTWQPMSTVGAPSPRSFPSGVWTGKYFIVWGGHDGVDSLDTGARYDPETDAWTPVTTTGAPMGRGQHAAVWTGKQMIIWGGDGDGGDHADGRRWASGKKYDPETDTWTPMSRSLTPHGISSFYSAWTGTHLIIWGGLYGPNASRDGAVYNDQTDTWTKISSVNAPEARGKPIGAWTGKSLLIWGGVSVDDPLDYLKTGYQYFYETDTWIPFSSEGAPEGRKRSSAVWSGTEMIIWGGSPEQRTLEVGARYTPKDAP